MANFTALYDSCVLYPAPEYLDTLLGQGLPETVAALRDLGFGRE